MKSSSREHVLVLFSSSPLPPQERFSSFFSRFRDASSSEMAGEAETRTNASTGLDLTERVVLSTLTTASCGVLFFVNATALFALRSRRAFRETSRYVLLYNLLLADTLQMSLSQVLYLLSVCRVLLTFPACGLMVMIANLTNEVSPLTLVVMSVERYVAVCFPLRHAAVVTARNTAAAVLAVWAVCSLNVVTRVLLLLDFPFEELDSLQMKTRCGTMVMFLGPASDAYDRAYTCFLFVLATAAIVVSYAGVAAAARAASSADGASARKARNTLLLHLVQLGFSLSSTLHNSLLFLISRAVTAAVLRRVANALYVLVIMLPRCLSALIYGLRDQAIRPVLLQHLCCGCSSNKVHT